MYVYTRKTPYRFKRKYRKKKKPGKVKKGIVKNTGNISYSKAKSTSIAKINKTLTSHVYDFIRTVDQVSTDYTFSASNISFSGFAWDFRLSDVANVAEFTTLFDSYQIVKVSLEFIPDTTTINRDITSNLAEAFTTPIVYVHRDLDNATAPTSETQMTERQSVMTHKATDRFTVSLVPQIGREVYRSAVATAYETPYKVVWLDTSYSDIPHYGVHVGITPTGSSTGSPRFQYKVNVKYWLRFKKAK